LIDPPEVIGVDLVSALTAAIAMASAKIILKIIQQVKAPSVGFMGGVNYMVSKRVVNEDNGNVEREAWGSFRRRCCTCSPKTRCWSTRRCFDNPAEEDFS